MCNTVWKVGHLPWLLDHCITAVSAGSARPDLLGDPWIGDKAGALGHS